MEGEKKGPGEAGGQQGKESVLLQGGDQMVGCPQSRHSRVLDAAPSPRAGSCAVVRGTGG